MIDRATVEKIARLARLRLTDGQSAAMTRQLAQILDYVDQLSELDTEGVEPLAHPLDLVNAFDPDELQPSLARDEVLSNAPKHDGECYLVPSVLGKPRSPQNQ